MSDVRLQVDHLSVAYGDLVAVWDVSLTARAGRTCALVGRNGAGKSTFLLGVAGLLKARSGVVSLDGEDITREVAHRRVHRGLALVPEGKRVLREMTVLQNLMIGACGLDRAKDRPSRVVLDEVLDRFPMLRERAAVTAGSLSGGQQQLLAIAQALMAQPAVLCLDEPSSGLAPLVVAEVFRCLDELRRDGLAIVLVEQQLEDVLSGVADDIVFVERGRSVLAGRAEDVTLDQLVHATLHGVDGHGA